MKNICIHKFYNLILGDERCVMSCVHCHKSRLPEEGFEVCVKCGGSGYDDSQNTKGFNCTKCSGMGRIGWTDKVVR